MCQASENEAATINMEGEDTADGESDAPVAAVAEAENYCLADLQDAVSVVTVPETEADPEAQHQVVDGSIVSETPLSDAAPESSNEQSTAVSATAAIDGPLSPNRSWQSSQTQPPPVTPPRSGRRSFGSTSSSPFPTIPEFGSPAVLTLQEQSDATGSSTLSSSVVVPDDVPAVECGHTYPPEHYEKHHGAVDFGRSVVRNIFEAMQWPTYHTGQLLKHKQFQQKKGVEESDSESDTDDFLPPVSQVPGLKKIFEMFDEVPFSTAFSGIDAPGTGLAQQVAELNYRIANRNALRQTVSSPTYDRKVGEPVHLNATEWFKPSQTELMNHPTPPKCLFGDITEFQHTYIRNMLSQLHANQKAREILSPLLKHTDATRLSGS